MADVEIDLEISNPEELIALGIRAHAIGDFSNAAAAFGRATQLMAQKHGDEHNSLGEIYLHYARALLEVSREEAEPLGDAIPHGESSSDSDEEPEAEHSPDKTEEPTNKKDDDNEVKQNGTEKTGTENKNEETNKVSEKKDEASKEIEKKGDANTEIEKKDETETGLEKKNDTNKGIENTDEVNTEIGNTDKKEDTKSEENKDTNLEEVKEEINGESSDNAEKNEDCSDLQLAWEVLEVAKKIFTTRGESGKERLSETMILLGEVAMESENFTDGVNDMKEGIDLQKSLYEPTNRKLAESYYKLGIAHATVSNIDDAISTFELSIETLKKRIKMLKDQIDEKKPDEVNKINEEVEEMETLIPEIEEKISDTKSIKEEMATQLLMEMANKMSKITPTKDSAATSSKSATDITHLVKRKRKVDDEATETSDGQAPKRPTP